MHAPLWYDTGHDRSFSVYDHRPRSDSDIDLFPGGWGDQGPGYYQPMGGSTAKEATVEYTQGY